MDLKQWLDKRSMFVCNMKLIQQAFMHSSYVNEHRSEHNNERLEFMGDAVLQLWSSDRIFRLTPSLPEGKMTTLRSQLVCEKALATYARESGLNAFVLLGSGEEKAGGRDRDSILADMFEAFLGALYLDSGMKNVDIVLNEVMSPRLLHPTDYMDVDYKTKLQEYIQADSRKSIHYEVISAVGPSNSPVFEVQVLLDGLTLGTGKGPSKKKAEQMAAKNAFEKMAR